MAGAARERIRGWMRRQFPPLQGDVQVFECADVTDLLPAGNPSFGIGGREGMIFASRAEQAPAPRIEVVLLTRTLACHAVEAIIRALENEVIHRLRSRPHMRQILHDDLAPCDWGPASTSEAGAAEHEPCEVPQLSNLER